MLNKKIESLITLDSYFGSTRIYPGINTSDISVLYNPYVTSWNEKKLSTFDVVGLIYNVSDAIYCLNTLIKPIYKNGYSSSSLTEIMKMINWNTAKSENYQKIWNYIRIFASFQVVFSDNSLYYEYSPLISVLDRKYSGEKQIPSFISWTMGAWIKSKHFKNKIVFNR